MSPWTKIPEWLEVTVRSTNAGPVTAKLEPLSAVPPGVVTLMGPVVAFGGTVAVICVVELKVKEALRPLKVTAEAESKLVPVMMTFVPAAPLAGEKPRMIGGGVDWPSTLLRSAEAIEGESAVKKV